MSTLLPKALYSASQVRELDRVAVHEFGIPGYELMQRAAQFSYDILKQKLPDADAIIVICGVGNNAGDGYQLASLALAEGKQVSLGYLIDPAKLKGDARTAFEAFLTAGGKAEPFVPDMFNDADIIADAIFGTGLDRDIAGEFAKAVEAMNDAKLPIVAIDIPSGLHADTGSVMGAAVQADLTCTFVGLKKGLFTNDGAQCVGEIVFNDLQVPDETYARVGKAEAARIDYEQFLPLLAPRQRNAYKGSYGHVLVVGGDSGFPGAARMAAEAAARVGAGLVSVATRAAHAASLTTARPEIMAHGVETLNELMPLIKRASVIAIGPGLGQSEWAQLLMGRVLESGLPLVIDADALNLLAEDPTGSPDWVITPHPGEAARLLQQSTADIQQDRFAVASALHKLFPGPVVLKGSGSLVVDSEGAVSVCDAGNPGMASGGMGDVLTGVIAGLIAQRLNLNDAVKLGVCLHAAAADRASVNGERGLLASDLMPHLRKLVNPL